jgi:hypothetical protein
MPDATLLEAKKITMFKFYTVDSNLLMGLTSLILAIYEIRFLKGKIDFIPNFAYILKLIGVSGITLTFLVTAFFLAPQYGFYAMYNNNNLFFHLIIPLLSLISYIFFEKHNNKLKYAFLGILPMFLYSIYYVSQIALHINGDIKKYDFYGFLRGDIKNAVIVLPVIYLITFTISFVIVLFNKIGQKSK